MIVVTGGAGFIGSYLVYELNKRGIDQIYIVDSFRDGAKWLNLRGLKYQELISPEVFWIEENRIGSNVPTLYFIWGHVHLLPKKIWIFYTVIIFSFLARF